MKHKCVLKKVIASFLLTFVFVGILASSAVIPVKASTLSTLPTVSGASSVYLYNFDSDRVLMKQSNLGSIAPAATVKIMTGLVGIDLMRNRLDEYVTVTEEMLSSVDGYVINLESGMTLQIRDILYGVVCGGGNDAATVLAIVCCGSVEDFVAQMNRYAQELGCTGTHYVNPTGIDDPQMNTTLDDTVIISEAAINEPMFIEMSSANNYICTLKNSGERFIFYNRNAQISSFSGIGYINKYAKGLNAGMTDRGGYCSVTYATNGDTSYLCIVMGATQNASGTIMSYNISNVLLNHLFGNYSYTAIAEAGTEVRTAPIRLALPSGNDRETTVPCAVESDVYGFLPKNIDVEKDLTYKCYFHNDKLSAPLSKGDVIGGVDIYYADELVASEKLIAAEDVQSSAILVALDKMKTVISSRLVIISAVVFICLLIAYIIFTSRKHKRNMTRTISYQNRR